MAQAPLLFALVLLFVGCVTAEVVALGNAFNFSATRDCAQGGELVLIHRLKDDSEVAVARRIDGVWTQSDANQSGLNYTGRIGHRSELTVALERINYNDDGLYEFTCRGRLVNAIQLEVVVPVLVSVFENQTAHLPCHTVTAGDEVRSVRWTRGKQLVAESDVSSGSTTYGVAFEGGVSVPRDGFCEGDFTLTVGRVRQEDQGDYLCRVYREDGGRGERAVVRLSVIRAAPQPEHEIPDKNPPHPSSFVTAVVLIPVCSVISFALGWWMKSCRPSAPAGSESGTPPADVQLRLLNGGTPGSQNGAALNGHR